MNTTEIPPPPKTPRVHIGGHGWGASIPAAVIVAVITTFGARMVEPSHADEAALLRAEVRELKAEVRELRDAQTALLTRLNGLDDAQKNARLVEALRAGRAP